MEVEDEMADIDELSMSILEPVPGMLPVADVAPAAVDDAVDVDAVVGDVTITINCRGEINVDQSALAEVLGSGQQTARVTFVKVDDGGQSTIENQVDLDASELLAAVGQQPDGVVADVVDAAGLGLSLDPDQLTKFEKAFESDEARNILGEAGVVESESRPSPGPTRRSQRQVDKETRETAEKIRAENQEQMKKEMKKSTTSPPTRGRGMMRGGSRPSRQRKKPKHLDDKDIVTELNKEEPAAEEEQEDEDEEEGDDDDDSDSGSWASEDDPDRLWCICQQPHSNKFMICCDQCLEWFHGKCVGITKAQGKEMEEAGQDWRCPTCIELNNTETTESVNKQAETSDTVSKSRRKSSESGDKKKVTGAKAESSFQTWLQQTSHATPGKLQRSSSNTSSKTGPKLIAPHRETPEKKKQSRMEDLIKKRPIKTKEEMVAEAKAALRRSVSGQDRPSKRERRSSDTERRPTPIKRKPEKPRPEPVDAKETKSSDKALRSMVIKGVRDALQEKVKKSDLKTDESKITKVAEEIEIAMFGKYLRIVEKYLDSH